MLGRRRLAFWDVGLGEDGRVSRRRQKNHAIKPRSIASRQAGKAVINGLKTRRQVSHRIATTLTYQPDMQIHNPPLLPSSRYSKSKPIPPPIFHPSISLLQPSPSNFTHTPLEAVQKVSPSLLPPLPSETSAAPVAKDIGKNLVPCAYHSIHPNWQHKNPAPYAVEPPDTPPSPRRRTYPAPRYTPKNQHPLSFP